MVLMPTLSRMKLLPCVLAIVLVAVLSSTGWARLGETPEQCEERYGPALLTKDVPKGDVPGAVYSHYNKAGLNIFATFYEGRVGEIFFEKEETNALGKAQKLSQAEIEALLAANGGGKEWKKVSPLQSGFGNQGWLLDDKSALAIYMSLENRLIFTDMGFSTIRTKNIEAREQQNLDGF